MLCKQDYTENPHSFERYQPLNVCNIFTYVFIYEWPSTITLQIRPLVHTLRIFFGYMLMCIITNDCVYINDFLSHNFSLALVHTLSLALSLPDCSCVWVCSLSSCAPHMVSPPLPLSLCACLCLSLFDLSLALACSLSLSLCRARALFSSVSMYAYRGTCIPSTSCPASRQFRVFQGLHGGAHEARGSKAPFKPFCNKFSWISRGYQVSYGPKKISYMNTYTHTCTHFRTHTMHTRTLSPMHTHKHIQTDRHTHDTHFCTRSHTYTLTYTLMHIHTLSFFHSRTQAPVYLCLRVCECWQMCAWADLCVWVCVCVRACVRAQNTKDSNPGNQGSILSKHSVCVVRRGYLLESTNEEIVCCQLINSTTPCFHIEKQNTTKITQNTRKCSLWPAYGKSGIEQNSRILILRKKGFWGTKYPNARSNVTQIRIVGLCWAWQ